MNFRIICTFLKVCFVCLILLLQVREAKLYAQKAGELTLKLPALIPYRTNTLWGYADSIGTIKITPKYQFAEPFEGPVAWVADNYKWGLIDVSGKELVKPGYQEINEFENGLAIIAASNSEKGVINLKGQEIVPVVYKYITLEKLPDLQVTIVKVNIEKPLTPAEKINAWKQSTKSVYGLFSAEGKRIIPVAFTEITYLSGGLFSACNEDACALFNLNGTEVLPLQKQYFSPFKEGLLGHCLNGLCGFADKNGKVIIPLKYQGVREFSEGLAAVYLQDKWGWINKEGKIIIEPVFSQTENFKNGFATVRKGQFWGVIDKKGNELTPFIYERIHYNEYENSFTLKTKERNFQAFYDSKTGNINAISNYYLSSGFHEGLAVAQKDQNKIGYVNAAGKAVIPAEYEQASPFYKGLAAVRKNWLWGVINKEGKTIVPFEFAELVIIDSNLFQVGVRSGPNSGTLFGFVNREGEEITPARYTKIEFFVNGLAVVHKNNSLGVINKLGQEVVPPVKLPVGYQLCSGWQNGLLKICHYGSNKNGFIDRYGRTYFSD